MATCDTVELCFQRRASRSVRGRSDLPSAHRARPAQTRIAVRRHQDVGPPAATRYRRDPLYRLTDVELPTADWVHWYNTNRLMRRLGRIPSLEYETVHYATNPSEAAHQ